MKPVQSLFKTEALVCVRHRNKQPLYPGAIINTQEMEVSCTIKLGKYYLIIHSDLALNIPHTRWAIWFRCISRHLILDTCPQGFDSRPLDLCLSPCCSCSYTSASYSSFSQSSCADNASCTSQNTAFLPSFLPSPPSSTTCSTVNSSSTRLQKLRYKPAPSCAFSLELPCFIYECLGAT